jgi:hypothetical protein
MGLRAVEAGGFSCVGPSGNRSSISSTTSESVEYCASGFSELVGATPFSRRVDEALSIIVTTDLSWRLLI